MSAAAERSIPATPRRREAARSQGMVPSAAALGWVAMVAAVVSLLPEWCRTTADAAADMMRQSLTAAVREPAGGQGTGIDLGGLISPSTILPTVVLVLASAFCGLTLRFLLDGSAWRLSHAAPDWRRVDPLAGVRRIASLGTLRAVLFNGCCLAGIVAGGVFGATPLVRLLADADLTADASRWLAAARGTLLSVLAAAVAVAAMQWALARLRFERRIRMTPEEFEDEMRGMEADPKIRLMRGRRTPTPAPRTDNDR
jgi:flagellar biosynthetic protein FlhB